MSSTESELLAKIKVLNDTVWENLITAPLVSEWLENFAPDSEGQRSERLGALYLLSNFMYFGSRQMRELLRALFRDKLRYRLIESFRRANNDTTDSAAIEHHCSQELENTRFIGMGNPSESGSHLLYYYRQENRLSKRMFIHAHDIFDAWPPSPSGPVLRFPTVRRYIFIDDFCGSGSQAIAYSNRVVPAIVHADPTAEVEYHVLFAMSAGLKAIAEKTPFHVECIHELDESFQTFHADSRCFYRAPSEMDRDHLLATCKKYGDRLEPQNPLGFDGAELLIGFHHNTPDNTLPVIWSEGVDALSWQPIFRRYPKKYGW